MKKVGFIGLGIMGKPMAINLIDAGYDLIVLDSNKAADDLTQKGAKAYSSCQEVAENSEIIITMLPDSPEVNEVVFGGGIVSGGGFVSTDYRKFYGLDEAEGDVDDAKATADEMERAAAAAKEIGDTELFEDGAPVHIEALADAAEAAYEAGMSIDEIMSMIEQHLGLKMGDF